MPKERKLIRIINMERRDFFEHIVWIEEWSDIYQNHIPLRGILDMFGELMYFIWGPVANSSSGGVSHISTAYSVYDLYDAEKSYLMDKKLCYERYIGLHDTYRQGKIIGPPSDNEEEWEKYHQKYPKEFSINPDRCMSFYLTVEGIK